MPPNFGRDLRRGHVPDVFVQIDGANPFRSETIRQYVEGVQNTLLADPGGLLAPAPKTPGANFQNRFIYNPTFESIYSIVPTVPAILLILIPAVLMTISIVREKELGSIINFYVTPTGRLEYLLGKQLPYVLIGMINFFILVGLALLVFGVPIKGSFILLSLCTLLYVMVTTGIGMLTSTFTSTQVAAVFVTAILTIQPSIQFSGMLQPVSTLEGSARVLGTIWPTTYYMHASLGSYTKGLGLQLMLGDMLYLLLCIPLLLLLSTVGLKKQEK
jgi:ribosome-dependent ATPase